MLPQNHSLLLKRSGEAMTDQQPDIPINIIQPPANITWAESGIIIKQVASIIIILAGLMGIVVTPELQAKIIALLSGLFVIGCAAFTIYDRIKKHAPPIVPKSDLAPRDTTPPAAGK